MNKKELDRIGQVLNCGGTGGTPGPCPNDYKSPTLKKNEEIVARLNQPTAAKKLTPKQAKEKEANFLQDKLNTMTDSQVGELAKKHGVDPSKYPSRFNLHRQIMGVQTAKSELLS